VSNVTNVIGSARQAIGPYFGLVSFLPSVLFVAYVVFLIESGSWSGEPDWSRAVVGLRELGVAGLALVTVAGIAMSAVLHPLQFLMVQLLEGYWGTGRLVQRLRGMLIRRHLRRRAELVSLAGVARAWLNEAKPKKLSPQAVRLRSLIHEADRRLDEYPTAIEDVMPTRFGNTLRRYERISGYPYDLDAPTVMPYLALVLPPSEAAYLADQRSAMDLAVRTCVIFVSFERSDRSIPMGQWLLVNSRTCSLRCHLSRLPRFYSDRRTLRCCGSGSDCFKSLHLIRADACGVTG
jgi:hypothetical protein